MATLPIDAPPIASRVGTLCGCGSDSVTVVFPHREATCDRCGRVLPYEKVSRECGFGMREVARLRYPVKFESREEAERRDSEVRAIMAKYSCQFAEAAARHREIEAMKLAAYLGTVEMVLYYDAEGNLLPARY